MWNGFWSNDFAFMPLNTLVWYYNMNNFEMHYYHNGCDNNADSQGDYEASNNSQYWNGTGGNGDDYNNNNGCCGGNYSD